MSWVFQASGLGYWRYEVANDRFVSSAGSKAVLGLGPDDELSS
ncbi:MAG: hypothetical protein K0S65_640, partial [Labilithrix sp.]|nr:hypothetical protein [Labilithrix sp.]